MSDIGLNLHVEPYSEAAIAFSAKMAQELWSASCPKRPHPGQSFLDATGVILGALLKVASISPARWGFRSMSTASFTGERVGHHSFVRITEALEALALIEVEKGFGSTWGTKAATKFRAAPNLLDRARRRGIKLSGWADHFRSLPRPSEISEPLVLKASSTNIKGRKIKGRRKAVDLTRSPACELAEQVNRLNEFIALRSIEPDGSHYAFHRVFNQGDDPSFNWNKGGRLISIGASYQQMKSVDRAKMLIDGEPVIEIDIRASHLTILHAKLVRPFNPSAHDPYRVTGIPREIVKAWVTMTLGHDRFQRCWSRQNKDKYAASGVGSGDLQKDYPIQRTREAILAKLDVLRDWPSCPVRWGELQFIESQIIVGTVDDLARKHGVPALPVHDSLIIPQSHQCLATDTLRKNFFKQTGVNPALSIK